MFIFPLPQLTMLLLNQAGLDAMSKYAQVSLAMIAYLGVGGSFAGWYISYRIANFEKELFNRLDFRFTTKEICNLKHTLDTDWGKGVE